MIRQNIFCYSKTQYFESCIDWVHEGRQVTLALVVMERALPHCTCLEFCTSAAQVPSHRRGQGWQGNAGDISGRDQISGEGIYQG